MLPFSSNPPLTLSQKSVKSIIFQNHSPAITCRPFKKWKSSLNLTLYLHSEAFDLESAKNFFSLKTLGWALSPDVRNYEGILSILNKCQVITIGELFATYLNYWKQYSAELEKIHDLSEDSESIMNWEIGKKVGFDKVLKFNTTRRLSLYQTQWAYLNVVRDRKNQNAQVENLFEALKPWLDKDLYFALEEKKDTTRTNIEFEKELEEAGIDVAQLDDSMDVVSR